MAKLIEVMPKNSDGLIILNPAGNMGGEPLTGTVNPQWFQDNFPVLADAAVPLSSENLNQLKGIDQFWSENADNWRGQGLI